MAPYVDIHTHATLSGLSQDIISILSLRVGVDNPDVFAHGRPFSFGVHPWDAHTVGFPEADIKHILTYGPVAVGEIGLDFLHNPDSRNAQLTIFRHQLQLAQHLQLPVIIHSVRTLHDVLAILRHYPTLIAVFHGFIGNSLQANDIIAQGHYISLAPTALRSPKTLNALTCIPPERLFLETDNSHTDIRILYAAVADQLRISVGELRNQLFLNSSKLFNTNVFPKLDPTH